MRLQKASRGYLCLVTIVVLGSHAFSQTSAGTKCTDPPAFYQNQNYLVRDVRIDAPLEWLLGSVERRLTEIVAAPSMPIKKGSVFRKADADAGFLKVVESFPELRVSRIDRVAIRIARPTLENCNAQTKTLDVVYRVYTLGFSYYLSRAFETGRKEEVKRSVVETSATRLLSTYFPQPYVGYNQSRGFFGGSKVTIKQPGGILERVLMEASGSSSSAEAKLEATGERELDTGFIRHLEYQLGYRYSNIPSTTTKLTEGLGLAQGFAATRILGTNETVLRFGGSFEAGNKQTDVDPLRVLPENLAQSPYGALKFFAGGTGRFGRHAFKASYGVQLGSAEKAAQLDFVKQVVDTAANLRFLIADHKPLTLDLQFTAGAIHKRKQLPVAERFFGGNSERNFIAGDSWIIRANPVIRSFPQNTFVQTEQAGVLGGDSFFSTNLTLAVPVWSKPLVPAEVLEDPDFARLVEFEFGSAESALKIEYLSQTPEFIQMANMVNPLFDKLKEVESKLNELEQKNLGQDINDQIALCRADLDDVQETVASIKKGLEEGSPKSADIRTLVVGFPTKKPPIPSQVSDLLDDFTTLKDMPGIPDTEALQSLITALESRQDEMASAFNELNQSPAAERATQEAIRTMKYPRRVFDELTREANLIAIGPMFIFDVARLRQQGSSALTRYAIGGGLRFTIVSLDVNAGYALNPGRKQWEPRGALLFSMEVSNLFR